MSQLLACQASASDLNRIVSRHTWSEDALLLAFSMNRFWFEPMNDQAEYLMETDQGRIFSPQGELKWRLVDKNYQLVYLGENGPSEFVEDYSHELQGLTLFTKSLFLWGERTNLEREWIEQQVPHRFDYPVKTNIHKKGRIKLLIQEWQNNAGAPCFSRYHSLQEVKGDKDA